MLLHIKYFLSLEKSNKNNTRKQKNHRNKTLFNNKVSKNTNLPWNKKYKIFKKLITKCKSYRKPWKPSKSKGKLEFNSKKFNNLNIENNLNLLLNLILKLINHKYQ